MATNLIKSLYHRAKRIAVHSYIAGHHLKRAYKSLTKRSKSKKK